jgi:hypothetical protein
LNKTKYLALSDISLLKSPYRDRVCVMSNYADVPVITALGKEVAQSL